MSLLMMRGALLAQGGDAAPPVDIGAVWQLDTTRRPAGYALSKFIGIKIIDLAVNGLGLA